MDPIAYCRDKAAPNGSSLHYALLFAPADRREPLLALQAFYKEVTEIVDECSDPGVAATKLNWWREELDRLFNQQPRHPVTQLVQPAIQRFGLERAPFDEVLAGVQMDLEYGTYPSFRELTTYCHRLGCSMTQLAVEICGYSDNNSLRYAHDLGMAFQLTRFLRHIPRHMAAGRLYIPEDELTGANVTREQLLQGETTEAIAGLIRQQADRTQDFYVSAMKRLPADDRANLRPLTVLAQLYSSLLDEMARDGFPVLERRHHLTPLRKLWIGWRTARRQRSSKQATETA